MPYVKLDCGILHSTVWADLHARDVFLTALLMAEPREIRSPEAEISTRSLEHTGWAVPPGWYGFVRAAGPGIVRMSGLEHEDGMAALERLASADPDSRSHDFDGRRMVRVDGGYIVLNFLRYREMDYTSAERSKRWREKHKKGRNAVASRSNGVTSLHAQRGDTQAEAEVEEDAEYPTSDVEPDPDVVSYLDAEEVTHEKPEKLEAEISSLSGVGEGPGKEIVPVGPSPVEVLEERFEKVRARAERREATNGKLEVATDIAFRYHRSNMGFDETRTRLTKSKKAHLQARLRENGLDLSELLYASDGCYLDDRAMGRVAGVGPWNDFINVYRNREAVERNVRTWEKAKGKRAEVHPFLATEASHG
jgi:hypothetical protein